MVGHYAGKIPSLGIFEVEVYVKGSVSAMYFTEDMGVGVWQATAFSRTWVAQATMSLGKARGKRVAGDLHS